MGRIHGTGLLLAAALLLAGCENDAVSWQGAEPGVSLTLIREQRWFWDRKAEVAVVVARMPECQRRHALRATRPADAQVDVFQAGAGFYLLRQGKDWHAASVGDCSLQPAEEPAEGLALVSLGAFDGDGSKLAFIPAPPQ